MTLPILTYTTLFPNAEMHRHGIFVETRLKHLRQDYPVQAEVVAPVPWFPWSNERYGLYAKYARVPRRQTRDGIQVHHPRYAVIPKVSWQVAPGLLYMGSRQCVRQIFEQRQFKVIDAHYFYPDGIAATMLGRMLNVPVVITARGSDITVMPNHELPRRMILWAARHCAAIITVSAALKAELVRLGVEPGKVTTLRNGVDLDRFKSRDGSSVRLELGVGDKKLLLSVGNLIKLKGNHLTIGALQQLPDIHLCLIGDGPEKAALEQQARSLGVAHRVHFRGTVQQSELPLYYSAADALILASRSEGWPNVLLEAMACGCPVIASNVWGTPEIVAAPAAGILMAERTPAALADAVNHLLAACIEPQQTRLYAEQFDWSDTSLGQYQLMSSLVESC